ncbi:hypothetical protein NS263_00635 [Curtobacterium oceanosedimentum]|uniref:DUF4190 domain-containing protein n=1 Tax=Curtobacterium oceanosedimentum TaxID=465820 RepID=A0ABR5SAD4_9MICO|nr:hypothetical protein [Curtobacterium oceanosedimentum]KTR43056.1 hypothetical protein NS263_00635 [Curtobacterium oceanosedimentum]
MPPLYAPSPLLTASSATDCAPRRTRPWAFATLSMLLGLGSVVLALVEPQHQGVPSGFVVSTIGVTAIVCGVQAVRRARCGSVVSRAFGRVGIILGSVGSALMLYALLAFGLVGVGVQLPALSLPSLPSTTNLGPSVAGVDLDSSDRAGAGDGQDLPAVAESDTGTAALPPAADPAAVPGTSGEQQSGTSTLEGERNALTQSAGTLSFVMRQHFPSGVYPTELVVAEQPSRLALTDGTGLASIPEGTRVLYSVATDRTAWSVTLVGAQHGSVVTYSSAVGTVQVG